MCLLILKKKDGHIKKESLQTAFNGNRDGVGFSFVRDGKLTTKKFRKFSKFFKQYESDVLHNSDSNFIVHFRLSTHGTSEGTFNVHPFKVSDDLVFAHNGMINNVEDDKKLSDTQVFNRDILQDLPTDFLSYKATRKLIGDFIGHSKLVFLNSQNDFTIINESLGHWNNNVWYSNNSYKSSGDAVACGWSYGYNYKPITLKPKGKSLKLKKSNYSGITDDFDKLKKCDYCNVSTYDLRDLSGNGSYRVCTECDDAFNGMDV